MKLRAKSLRRIKIAPRTRIVKIGALILSQFGLLAALNLQFFGMVTAYKMMALKRNLSLAAYLSAEPTSNADLTYRAKIKFSVQFS